MALTLATRGSALALRQAASVQEALETRRRSVELVEVETTGDQLRDELITRLGKTGAFVRALDERVMAGECDAAVHSLKDVPTDFPEELVVAGVPERASARDVLVTPDGGDGGDGDGAAGDDPLDALAEGAVVGTSSLRRRAQLLAERPDLAVVPLRGNVDTRLQKLLAPTLQREHERRLEADEADGAEDAALAGDFDESTDEWFDSLSELERQALGREVDTEYDAVVLAEAGIQRLGLAHQVDYERLPPERFVPAPGQGAIAVTALAEPAGASGGEGGEGDKGGEGGEGDKGGEGGEAGEDVAATINEWVDHPPTRVATTVERVVLAELGGGCVAPVGIYARLQGEYVNCIVRVLDRDGTEEVRATRDLPVERHPSAAREFAADLRDEGAADLIEQARVREDEARDAKREGQ